MAELPAELQLRVLLRSATIGGLARMEYCSATVDDSVEVVHAKMRDGGHDCALVFDQARLVGIFTERDLLFALNRNEDLAQPITQLMTTDPQTVSHDASLLDAVELMDTGGYRRLPVLDSERQPDGVIDAKMLTSFLVEHYPEAVYNQASQREVTARHREGA